MYCAISFRLVSDIVSGSILRGGGVKKSLYTRFHSLFDIPKALQKVFFWRVLGRDVPVSHTFIFRIHFFEFQNP